MPRICPLFSGSKANSTVIQASVGAFVVDIGCSYKMFLKSISEIGISIDDIRAIMVTHEHSDHIAGLKTFLKNNDIPLIASERTVFSLIAMDVIPANTDIILSDETETEISGCLINRFPTSHDCMGSSGYSLTMPKGERVAVCTDTGVLTKESKEMLLGCKAVLIESNHDVSMLKNGPYPPNLKMRILSKKGHLSNNDCASFLPELLKSGTQRFVLGHLSQNNNTPLLARSASRNSLMDIGAKDGFDYILSVAKPDSNEVIAF